MSSVGCDDGAAMRIWIDESGDLWSPAVAFSSETGNATGLWHGDAPPRPGEHDVEIEIPGTYRWGDNVRPGGSLATSLSTTHEGFRVTGRAVGLDPDGMLWLDVDGGVVMVETDGQPPQDIVGRVIELDAPALEIYPTSI
jgi:hypothetical protein